MALPNQGSLSPNQGSLSPNQGSLSPNQGSLSSPIRARVGSRCPNPTADDEILLLFLTASASLYRAAGNDLTHRFPLIVVAAQGYLIVLAALAPACPRPRV
jgi:hypothetical protein